MDSNQYSTPFTAQPAPAFATTRWSLIARAGGQVENADSRAALSDLCGVYWYPIYAFARRKGHQTEDARDLVQGFFTSFLERGGVSGADSGRGRFRSYLVGAFIHFSANEWDRDRAEKRGGDRATFSMDQDSAEGRFRDEPSTADNPEQAFERAWALQLIETVIVCLRTEYEEGGKGLVFDRLRPMLSFDGEAESYRSVADEMETTEGAVKVAVHRLRKRFAILLRRAIADTVETPDEVDDEIRGLFDALGS